MKKVAIIFIIGFIFLAFPLVSSKNFPTDEVSFTTYTGNLTNLSQMQDVNIPWVSSAVSASVPDYSLLSYVANITDFPTLLSYFTDNLGDRGYTSVSNFTNDFGYYNSTTLPASTETLWNANYSTFLTHLDWSEATNGTLALVTDIPTNNNELLNGAGFYNSTDFDIADYYLESNPFGFYNITDFSIADYLTKTQGDLLYYDLANSYGYYNSTTLPAAEETLWNANYSDYLEIKDFTTNNTFYLDSNPDSFISAETLWNANYSDFENVQDLVTNNTFYLDSNPDSFVNWATAANGTLALSSAIPTNNNQLLNGNGYYNSTDFSISDYFTKTNILDFGYYNSTDFSIGDYYLDSNPDNFINWANAINGTLLTEESDPVWESEKGDYYLKSNPYSYYNVTTAPTYINDTFAGNYSTYLTLFNWNKTYADTLYYAITNPYGFYNSTSGIGNFSADIVNYYTLLHKNRSRHKYFNC